MNSTTNQLTINGRITEIGSAVQGETWAKQDFTIETIEQYPKTINIHVWNDKMDQLSRCKLNDIVNCNINISSRKHENRYYTEVVAWKVDLDFKAMKTQTANTTQNA
jgi:CTP-dependent riboflavin kinase